MSVTRDNKRHRKETKESHLKITGHRHRQQEKNKEEKGKKHNRSRQRRSKKEGGKKEEKRQREEGTPLTRLRSETWEPSTLRHKPTKGEGVGRDGSAKRGTRKGVRVLEPVAACSK